jgi:hypothetical protein
MATTVGYGSTTISATFGSFTTTATLTVAAPTVTSIVVTPATPTIASMARMNAFNEELRKAGVMRDCDGLRPSTEGKRVRFDGDTRTVVDGLFQGGLVAGYWI